MPPPYEHSRRAVYRVVYPPGERPTFRTGIQTHAVIDCSELGLRYMPGGPRPEPGSSISGEIVFRRGNKVAISGEVIRADDNGVAIWFGARGIPLGEILSERSYLASGPAE
jgi:hypothetical protein